MVSPTDYDAGKDAIIAGQLAARMKWNATFNSVFFTSADPIVVTGNTGIIATPLVTSGSEAILPLYFVAVGTDMAGDETNDIKIEWYGDAAGNGGIIGTTTFDQLTAGGLTDLEVWPGDVTAFDSGRDFVPMFPFHKITWTLVGTTKSMAFILYLSYMQSGN